MLEMKYYRLPSVGRVWWSTGVILGNRCIAWESTGITFDADEFWGAGLRHLRQSPGEGRKGGEEIRRWDGT